MAEVHAEGIYQVSRIDVVTWAIYPVKGDLELGAAKVLVDEQTESRTKGDDIFFVHKDGKLVYPSQEEFTQLLMKTGRH